MAAIHIVKNDQNLPQIRPIEPGSDVYSSGFWVVAEATANALIGGKIYFHDQQAKPSFFGGIITGVEVVREGERAGRVVFTFKFCQACKDVSTSRDSWAQEMKIIL